VKQDQNSVAAALDWWSEHLQECHLLSTRTPPRSIPQKGRDPSLSWCAGLRDRLGPKNQRAATEVPARM